MSSLPFNLGELLTLPILIFFILVISGFNFRIPFLKSLPTVLLESLEYGVVEKDGYIVKITGLETGFVAWLLAKLNLRSRVISFTIDDNFITQGKTGRYYLVNNLTDIYSVKSGYSSKLFYLIFSVAAVFAVVFGIMVSFLSSGGIENDAYVGIFIALLTSGFFYWLYKRSGALFLRVEHRSARTVIGLRIKSGLTGKEIRLEDMKAIEDKILVAARLNSRWFNTYYTR